MAQLGRAARAGRSGGRSKGAQGTALARLRRRDGKCKAASAKIDKSLFERWKGGGGVGMGGKKKGLEKLAWLCHFWRTFTFSDQERKNGITHEKLRWAEALFLFSAAWSRWSIARWREGPESVPRRNGRVGFFWGGGGLPAGEAGGGSCSAAHFTPSVYRNSDFR